MAESNVKQMAASKVTSTLLEMWEKYSSEKNLRAGIKLYGFYFQQRYHPSNPQEGTDTRTSKFTIQIKSQHAINM